MEQPSYSEVVIDNTIVIETDEVLSSERMARLLDALEGGFPGRKVVVLTNGVRISRDEQLKRIEAKLDALLDAMAEEEEGEIGATSLDEKGESRRPATL